MAAGFPAGCATPVTLARSAPLPVPAASNRACGSLLPFGWVARLGSVGQERFSAARAAAILRPEEPDGRLVRWRGDSLAPPVGPVGGQGRVVGRRPAAHRDVADDLRPGELGEAGAGIPVAEDPSVLPGLVEPAEVPGRDPAPRLVRVRVPGPPVGDVPDMVVQPGEDPAGDTAPVVGRPAPDNGVQPVHDGCRVRPAHRADLSGQPLPEPLHLLLAGSNEQLAAALPVDVAPDVEPQERPRRGVLQKRGRFGAAAQRSERLEIPRFRRHFWNSVGVWRVVADD